MIDQLAKGADRLRRWYSARQSHLAFRLLRVLVTLSIVAVSAWFIWQQMAKSYTTIDKADLQIEAGRLLVSWLCIASATALGAWEWVMLVNALGGRLDLGRGITIHLTSNLAKYLPGFIWPYAGKAYLATRQGVPRGIALLGITGEFAIVYLDGALLALLCLPFAGIVSWPIQQRILVQVGASIIAGLGVLGLPALLRWLVRSREPIRSRLALLERTNWFQVSLVMVAVLLTWCLLGCGFGVLYEPIGSSPWQHFLRHTFALVAALLFGQVVFFVPTGVGLREAALVAILAQENAALVIILAVVFRVEMVVGEIICALLAVAVDRLRPHFKPQKGNNTSG